MSGWDDYIKLLMTSADCIKKGAIIGAEDGALWAKSTEFNASAEELKTLASQFEKYQEIPQNGIVLEKVKFIVPRCEENLIFGKKMKLGVFACKTASVIIIAIFEGEGGEASVTTRISIEKLAKYLKDVGF